MNAHAAHAWLQFDSRWTFAIAALWLIATLARATDLILHVARLRRLWRAATPVDILQLSGTHTRAFQVCSTPDVDRPNVIGFFAPRVLIPDWLLPRLTAGELHQIVLHESTHLARRDDWTNLFQKLCLVLLPLNPALFWLDRQLAKERERSCDEAVVRITQAPRAYAACLASLAERGLTYQKEALSLGAWRRRSELVDRVHRILGRNRLMHPAAARISAWLARLRPPRGHRRVGKLPAAGRLRTGSARRWRNCIQQPSRAARRRGLLNQPAQRNPHAGRPYRSGQINHAFGFTDEAVRKPGSHEATRSWRAARAGSEEPGISPRDLAAQRTASQAPALRNSSSSPRGSRSKLASPANQTVADYDTNADAEADSSRATGGSTPNNTQPDVNASRQNNARPDANPSAPISTQRRSTFTQLILRVAPAGDKSSQPTAIPFGDGWLVIQL